MLFRPRLVANLPGPRGMKHPILYNPKTSSGYRRELRRNLTPAEALGIRVIRFENRAVFDSLELVLNSIRLALSEQRRIF